MYSFCIFYSVSLVLSNFCICGETSGTHKELTGKTNVQNLYNEQIVMPGQTYEWPVVSHLRVLYCQESQQRNNGA
jgi:hypothetical protein